jgi:hypothetical protein
MTDTSILRLRIFDGSRELFAASAEFLITITDGNKNQQVRQFYTENDITFELPFFDNFGDLYTVVVWAKGYQQAGYTPVKLSNTYTRTLDIMLISETPGFSFVNARFPAASAAYPFLAAGADNATGEARYDKLVEEQKPLACLLNLAEAMSQMQLTQGTPLTYIKEVIWDGTNVPGANAPAQDRFFAWCDPELINQIKSAPPGQFAEELNPGLLHPGATSSWKQIEFGEANVQLTFHENNTQVINDVNCVMVEPDIDYYRDLLAHTILEVIPNALDNSLTDPAQVYVLRWIAGQTAGIPEFAPLYTIT